MAARGEVAETSLFRVKKAAQLSKVREQISQAMVAIHRLAAREAGGGRLGLVLAVPEILGGEAAAALAAVARAATASSSSRKSTDQHQLRRRAWSDLKLVRQR